MHVTYVLHPQKIYSTVWIVCIYVPLKVQKSHFMSIFNVFNMH